MYIALKKYITIPRESPIGPLAISGFFLTPQSDLVRSPYVVLLFFRRAPVGRLSS